MSRTNPSFVLSLEEVDEIIDRVLKGKYAKKKPTPQEVMQTGLYHVTSAARWRVSPDTYIRERFTELTKAGRTMRGNKLMDKMNEVFRGVGWERIEASPMSVWQVRSRNYDSEYVYIQASSSELARNTAWLIWGWMWADNEVTASNLRVLFVGLGGALEANRRNVSLVTGLKEQLARLDREVSNLTQKANTLRDRVEMAQGVMAVSALDAGVAAAEEAAARA